MRQFGSFLVVVSAAASLLALALPVIGPVRGWDALRLTSTRMSADGRIEWASVACVAANVLYAAGLLVGAIGSRRRVRLVAAASCLSAAVLGRLGAALIDGLNDWGGVNYLIGHWVWIGSMLSAAVGLWILGLSVGTAGRTEPGDVLT